MNIIDPSLRSWIVPDFTNPGTYKFEKSARQAIDLLPFSDKYDISTLQWDLFNAQIDYYRDGTGLLRISTYFHFQRWRDKGATGIDPSKLSIGGWFYLNHQLIIWQKRPQKPSLKI